MSEQRDQTIRAPRVRVEVDRDEAGNSWMPVEEDVVAMVTADDEVASLLVFGEITSERLRQINLGRLDLLGLTGWAKAPTREQLADRMQRRLEFIWVDIGPDGEEVESPVAWPASDPVGFVREILKYRDTWSEQDYLMGFALAMQVISPVVKSAHQTMAEALDLAPNTVKSYVYRCRKLGYLKPTRRIR